MRTVHINISSEGSAYFLSVPVQELVIVPPAFVALLSSATQPPPSFQAPSYKGQKHCLSIITLAHCQDFILTSLCEMEMGTRGEDTLLSPAILFFKGQVSLGDNYRIDGESEMALRKEDC